MRAASKNRGYTVVEVMLFMAISGFMFVLAANFISGKQAAAEFKQGINDVNSQVRTVINDVSNGYYPNNGDFSCTAAVTGPPNLVRTSPKDQGENIGCVFLGKVIQFAPNPAPGGGEPTGAYNVYTVAGRQFAPIVAGNAIEVAQSFAQSEPVVAAPPPATRPNLTQPETFKWGLRVARMFTGPANSPTDIGAIGFFGSFGRYGGGNALESGSQNLLSIPIPGIGLGMSPDDLVGKFPGNAAALDTAANNNPTVTICFDGGRSKYGSLKIGGEAGQRLTTVTKIGSNWTEVGCPA